MPTHNTSSQTQPGLRMARRDGHSSVVLNSVAEETCGRRRSRCRLPFGRYATQPLLFLLTSVPPGHERARSQHSHRNDGSWKCLCSSRSERIASLPWPSALESPLCVSALSRLNSCFENRFPILNLQKNSQRNIAHSLTDSKHKTTLMGQAMCYCGVLTGWWQRPLTAIMTPENKFKMILMSHCLCLNISPKPAPCYLCFENAEGYVLIANYLFIYLFVCVLLA